MEIEKSIFFLCSIPYLDIILRPSMFLESSISTSNMPKSSKIYLRRYWRNRQPVLANSPTGIAQFAYGYWRNHQPVLAKSYAGLSWPEWFFCPGNFFANSSQIYIIRWRPFPSNKIHSPSGGYPANVTGISGYLLQNDYRKWNFPMTQSVCCSVRWFIVWSVGRPVGLS